MNYDPVCMKEAGRRVERVSWRKYGMVPHRIKSTQPDHYMISPHLFLSSNLFLL
jgi:hypothetical protein